MPVFKLKIGKGLRDINDATLRFFRQMGVEHVVMPSRYNTEVRKRGLVPGDRPRSSSGADVASLGHERTHPHQAQDRRC